MPLINIISDSQSVDAAIACIDRVIASNSMAAERVDEAWHAVRTHCAQLASAQMPETKMPPLLEINHKLGANINEGGIHSSYARGVRDCYEYLAQHFRTKEVSSDTHD